MLHETQMSGGPCMGDERKERLRGALNCTVNISTFLFVFINMLYFCFPGACCLEHKPATSCLGRIGQLVWSEDRTWPSEGLCMNS